MTKPEDIEHSPSLRGNGPMPSGFAPCGCRQFWDAEKRIVIAACELRQVRAEKCKRRVRRKKDEA